MKILPLAALLLFTTTACSDLGGYRLVTDGYRFSYKGATAARDEAGALAAGIRRVEVDHRFGDVKVEAAPPGEATGWVWSAEVWADDPDLAEMVLDEVALITRDDGRTMTFELRLPEMFKGDLRGLRSKLTVLVDPAVEVDMKNAHGDVRVEGVGGDVAFYVSHGDTHFAALGGQLDGTQSHGELFADGIQGAKLETSHGRVTMRNAGPLEVKASHGDGTYDGIRGAFTLDQKHGDVEIHDAPKIHGSSAHCKWRAMDIAGLQLESSHGDVQVRLVAGSARVDTQHGDVTIERAGVASEALADDHIRCGHGDVKLDLRGNGYADIDVAHGNVTIYHAMGGGAAIDARASYGDVHSDLPVVNALAVGKPGAKVRTTHGNIRCVAAGDS